MPLCRWGWVVRCHLAVGWEPGVGVGVPGGGSRGVWDGECRAQPPGGGVGAGGAWVTELGEPGAKACC